MEVLSATISALSSTSTLRIAKQFLSCALVWGRGVVLRHHYKSIAKTAGKDYRDGAVVPFE